MIEFDFEKIKVFGLSILENQNFNVVRGFSLAILFLILSILASYIISIYPLPGHPFQQPDQWDTTLWFPLPETFSKIFSIKDTSIRDSKFYALLYKPVCLGVQCHYCLNECFLLEGLQGICKQRFNSGGKIKTILKN